MTTGLPEGWATIRVGDYFHSWGGMTPSTSNTSYWGGNVPWVSSKDIKAWRIAGGEEFITRKALQETRLRLCPVGSVLVVVRSGILAHTLPIAVVDAPVSINQDLKAFYCTDSDLNEWLALALRSLTPEILANNRKDGTTVQSVRYEELCDLIIQVPPSHEQKRITAQLGSLLEKVGSSRERLSRVPAILKRFRQAVLAAACSGKLTEDWRQLHAEEDSVASLRQSIATKRARAWESAQSAKLRKRRYPEPAPLDEAELPEIPETWTWVSADEVCSQITDGEHIQPRYQAAGLPMITATHVRDGFVEFTDVGLISEEDFQRCLERCAPAKNDVLIVSVGATTGRAAIVPECQPFAMVRSVLLLRPLMEPKFLLRWVQSRWSQTWISQASGASAQPHFYIHDNKRMPVPLPPTSEQAEIVRRVDALFALADTIEGHARAAIFRADKLTQSILAKAFRGELVPTEAELARREGREYEPASVLLERIKKERESLPDGKRKQTRKSRQRNRTSAARGTEIVASRSSADDQ